MARSDLILAIFFLTTPLVSWAEDLPNAEKLIEQSMPSIVSIRAETPDGVSSGTGFIVDPSGAIVTNMHVIQGARRAAVKLHTGEQYSRVMVSSFDRDRDLAVLRIPGNDLPAMTLGDSDAVKVGATVYAIGNPLGLEKSVTRGIVSSIRVGDEGSKIIQTDSAVSPGNSGGPLIDANGEVVGIVTFKIRGGESLNFAVPSNYAQALLGFETLMSLDEFVRETSQARVSLFDEDERGEEGGISGTWLSLTTNTERELTFSGDYLYGTYDQDDTREGTISNGTYDLKRVQGNKYKGIGTSNWNCWYYRHGARNENFCSEKVEMELILVTPDRIEARAYMRSESVDASNGRAFRKFCDSCGEDLPQDWQEFVWVRKE